MTAQWSPSSYPAHHHAFRDLDHYSTWSSLQIGRIARLDVHGIGRVAGNRGTRWNAGEGSLRLGRRGGIRLWSTYLRMTQVSNAVRILTGFLLWGIRLTSFVVPPGHLSNLPAASPVLPPNRYAVFVRDGASFHPGVQHR